MNREIKFRAWHKGKNKFLYFTNFEVRWDAGFILKGESNGGHCYHCFGQEIDETIQQWTGLKGKNGREIYEGDIITYTEKMHEHGDAQQLRGKVIYDPERAAFGISNTGDLDGIWNYFTDMVIGNFEVVGNVFEGAK